MPTILAEGAAYYRDFGTGRSRGTLPIQLGGNVKRGGLIERAIAFAKSADDGAGNTECRHASSALYHATSAALMAWEASKTGDGKRLILSRLVTDHRLTTKDPLTAADDGFGKVAAELLLDRDQVNVEEAAAAMAG